MSRNEFAHVVAKARETVNARKNGTLTGPDVHYVDKETAYGTTVQLSFQVRVL